MTPFDLTLKKARAQCSRLKSRFNYLSSGRSLKKRKNVLYILLYFLIVFFLSNILKDTPLTEAVANGRTDIVRSLIKNGANVNQGGLVR